MWYHGGTRICTSGKVKQGCHRQDSRVGCKNILSVNSRAFCGVISSTLIKFRIRNLSLFPSPDSNSVSGRSGMVNSILCESRKALGASLPNGVVSSPATCHRDIQISLNILQSGCDDISFHIDEHFFQVKRAIISHLYFTERRKIFFL